VLILLVVSVIDRLLIEGEPDVPQAPEDENDDEDEYEFEFLPEAGPDLPGIVTLPKGPAAPRPVREEDS